MKRLTINPSNKPYYSEDFIKGFEYGTQRQLEADLADRPRGKWIDRHGNKVPMTEHSAFCSNCGEWSEYLTNYCGHCGADMKGADDE